MSFLRHCDNLMSDGESSFPTQTEKDVKSKNEENCENCVFRCFRSHLAGGCTRNDDFAILAQFREAGNKRDTRFCTKVSFFHYKNDYNTDFDTKICPRPCPRVKIDPPQGQNDPWRGQNGSSDPVLGPSRTLLGPPRGYPQGPLPDVPNKPLSR